MDCNRASFAVRLGVFRTPFDAQMENHSYHPVFYREKMVSNCIIFRNFAETINLTEAYVKRQNK